MPAAAVAPAPMGNIKVVAVKKLVVGFRNAPVGTPQGELVTVCSSLQRLRVPFTQCAQYLGRLL